LQVRCFVEATPEDEAGVLNGVVVVDPEVALGLYLKVHAGVVSEEVQDVVEETDPSLYLCPSLTVEFETHPHVRLPRPPLGRPGPRQLLSFSRQLSAISILSDASLRFAKPNAHALGVVLEAFKAGEAFDMGA
jgi:hypothetical protein